MFVHYMCCNIIKTHRADEWVLVSKGQYIVVPTELNCLYLNVLLIQLFVNHNKSFRKNQPSVKSWVSTIVEQLTMVDA